MASYQMGVVVRVAWVVSVSGTATDPSAMTFEYKHGSDGTVTILTMGVSAALVKDSVGNYHVDITTIKEGTIYYRVETTGTLAIAEQGMLDVIPSYF